MINTAAAPQERYLYSPFGSPTFLNGTMTTILSGSSIDSELLFTGQRFDTASSLNNFRNRYLNSQLGTFCTRDSLYFLNNFNVYAAAFVPNDTDPSGHAPMPFLSCCCLLLSRLSSIG